jgi:hypothetical protein
MHACASLPLIPHLSLSLCRFLEEQDSRRKVKKARKAKFAGVVLDRGDED